MEFGWFGKLCGFCRKRNEYGFKKKKKKRWEGLRVM